MVLLFAAAGSSFLEKSFMGRVAEIFGCRSFLFLRANRLLDQVKNNKVFHVMGLLSRGGVHSHSDHLYLVLDFLREFNELKVNLHLFTDGRDSGPLESIGEFNKLLDYISGTNIN